MHDVLRALQAKRSTARLVYRAVVRSAQLDTSYLRCNCFRVLMSATDVRSILDPSNNVDSLICAQDLDGQGNGHQRTRQTAALAVCIFNAVPGSIGCAR